MEKTNVTNNHLKAKIQEFKGYLDKDEDAPQDVFIDMMNELRVSNLIIPGSIEDEYLNFEQLISEEDDSTAIPLFTDDDEFIKSYGEDYELSPIACDFDYYLELIEGIGTDAIIINPESEEFLFESEMLLDYPFAPVAESEDDSEGYEAEKLLETAKEVTNDSLVEFIRSGDSQFEALMLELEKSSLLNVISYEDAPDEDIISLDDDYEMCTTSIDDGEYGMLFTGVDAIKEAEIDGLCQLTLLDEFFEFVLTGDMEGIVINPGVDDYIIPRSYVLDAYGGLAYSKPEFKNAMDFAFRI